ncbi:glycosyltransferase family 4 protein [Pseudomonas sp. SCB32]|uniref:glycosyltransferase family 4 protein n=1 Tax=Pseudomonas sp. SCB32 TaxID=2653853 RepID=UPI0012649E86|nr:glycosyltransferase [Pseudomonas sp. SCB32]
MSKILAFSFFPAFTPPSNGGESRLFNIYSELSRAHEVVLLSSTFHGVEESIIQHGSNFIERRIPKDNAFADSWNKLNAHAGSGGGDLSAPSLALAANSFGNLHRAYLEEYAEADIIIHEFPFTIGYDIFAGMDGKPRIYDAHNCESDLYKELHDANGNRDVPGLVMDLETRMLKLCDMLFYCSPNDLGRLKEICPSASFDATFIPNGMTPKTSKRVSATAGKSLSAAFIGSGHPPNVLAAKRIVEDIAPALPEVTFHIIGTCLPEGKYPSNVIRHGRVSDKEKEQILWESQIALNPMDQGSGSNVKVLDYLSHSMVVISSEFGMRGIEANANEHYIAAEIQDFPQAIRNIVDSPDVMSHIAAAGAKLASERYTWASIADRASSAINQLLESSTAPKAEKHVLVLNDYNSFKMVGGGATRTQGMYSAVKSWAPVILICFSDRDFGVTRVDERIHVISIPISDAHRAELHETNRQFHISADDIIAGKHCATNSMFLSVYRALRKDARCVIIEHPYLSQIPVMHGDRFIYSSQNDETLLKQRLLEYHPLRESLIAEVSRLEKQAVECAAAVVAVSEDDAVSLLEERRSAGPCIVVRNGALAPAQRDEQLFETCQRESRSNSVVFLGSAHMPNVDSANFIIENVAGDCPDMEFHFIGSVCDAIATKPPKNVKLWGVLDDGQKSAVLQSCKIALNPMMGGGGSNVKLADYLGNGLFTVTTSFGQRGYPQEIQEHISICEPQQFADTIKGALQQPDLFTEEKRLARRQLFDNLLSMSSLASGFVGLLKGLEKQRKRALFVTYRYTAPAAGGAEAMLHRLLRSLGSTDEFQIDVVAPEVSVISNQYRFAESYGFSPVSAFPDMPNTRFARFPLDPQSEPRHALEKAWRVQARFEHQLNRQLEAKYQHSGLGWGWGSPSSNDDSACRWAFTSCGIYCSNPTEVRMSAYSHGKISITVRDAHGRQLLSVEAERNFELCFSAPQGGIEISSSAEYCVEDPRPLAFLVRDLYFDGTRQSLASALEVPKGIGADDLFEHMHAAARATRFPANLRLTDIRGPHSASMERYIAEHAGDYDLIITHNVVFRPAVLAVEHANRNKVPVVLIPHTHLDDDYYHFPDLHEAALNADLVLASPKAACRFYEGLGANSHYLPAGVDCAEGFTEQDRAAFKAVWPSKKRFVLVLGRKAGAKGYRDVIAAVEAINARGEELHAILIGPDDDQQPIVSPHATYLGMQPRNVVRGALQCSETLVNMSSSESFGIVLLEGWLAGTGVIANESCAAFHDMATDGLNALLTSPENLPAAILRVIRESGLRDKLAANGKRTAQEYDWSEVGHAFSHFCRQLVN